MVNSKLNLKNTESEEANDKDALNKLVIEKEERVESKERGLVIIQKMKEIITENSFKMEDRKREITKYEKAIVKDDEETQLLKNEMERRKVVMEDNIYQLMDNLEKEITRMEFEIEEINKPIK